MWLDFMNCIWTLDYSPLSYNVFCNQYISCFSFAFIIAENINSIKGWFNLVFHVLFFVLCLKGCHHNSHGLHFLQGSL